MLLKEKAKGDGMVDIQKLFADLKEANETTMGNLRLLPSGSSVESYSEVPAPQRASNCDGSILTLLAEVEGEFKRREQEKKASFRKWVEEGTNLNSITIAYLIDYMNIVAATAFFPPIADPALWQPFRDNSSKNIKTGHDHWNRDELYGDKILTVVSLSLFMRYRIPYSWCVALCEVLLSNVYFRKPSKLHNLRGYLFHRSGNKIDADAFEVYAL
jgi:hypothetical protein